MYLEHFGFHEQPFGAAPDPRFLYFSREHAEAFAAIHYGLLERRGLLLVTAPAGTGKTTLLYHLMDVWRDRAEISFVFHPPDTREEMLAAALEALKLAPAAGYREACQCLYARAEERHRDGKRLILIFDEAQAMPAALLEEIRLFSNCERPSEKLIDIILAGQTGLTERLASPEYEQLRQRIAIHAAIGPLEAADVRRYVEHRLRRAGRRNGRLFTSRALRALADASDGIPRNINAICFEALSAACARGKKRVDEQEIAEAVKALAATTEWTPVGAARRRPHLSFKWAAAACATASVTASTLFYLYWHPRHPATTQAASAAVASVDAVPPGPAVPAALEADDARSGPQGPDAAPAPEAPAEEAQAEPEGRRVRVQPAENLRRIALREYGRWNDTVWQHIQKHNAWLEDPHKLKAGEELLLPPGDFSRKPEEKAP